VAWFVVESDVLVKQGRAFLHVVAEKMCEFFIIQGVCPSSKDDVSNGRAPA